MSSPPIIINQTQPAPIKRGRGRPRKIDNVPNAIPSDKQRYRIFKSIIEPNILDNLESQITDLKTQLEELYLNSLDPMQKIQKSFDESMDTVQTNNFVDYNGLQQELNKKRADRKERKEQKKKGRDDKYQKKQQSASISSSSKSSAMSKKSTLPKAIAQEIQTQTEDMPDFNYVNRTIDGRPMRKEDKKLSKTISSKNKVSQGTSAPPLTKEKEINKAGIIKKNIKLADPNRFKNA